MITRRQAVCGGLKMLVGASAAPCLKLSAESRPATAPLRCINIMNFIRAEEPREKQDLFQPVREQMAAIRRHGFAATWLLQYDALVEGPFVEFLKSAMPRNHEAGLWFEMNRRICDGAGIAWRGRPDWEWDYHVPVAYPIGYTPAERRKLADTAMAKFRQVFGYQAKTVASWNLDAVSIAHLADQYGVDAFANCRDQIATDGFTVWGAPIAGYYPSRVNAWSPALEKKNQIGTPMFRLLGQDPVYYYDNHLPKPDTMEPVWPSGQSPVFVDRFLHMIAKAPTQQFAYAQLGQENSFGWPAMKSYAMQIEALAHTASGGAIHIETMSETGRRFKQSFPDTPTQAQVMLEDPFGDAKAPQRTAWYQSKYYRANLHFWNDEFYLRDVHVYADGFEQPYLNEVVRQHGIEQRMLAVLDGYHWSDEAAREGRGGTLAMGQFVAADRVLKLCGEPQATETDSILHLNVPVCGGEELHIEFSPRKIEMKLASPAARHFALHLQWAPDRSAFRDVSENVLRYRFHGFDYAVRVAEGTAATASSGVRIKSGVAGKIRLELAQS